MTDTDLATSTVATGPHLAPESHSSLRAPGNLLSTEAAFEQASGKPSQTLRLLTADAASPFFLVAQSGNSVRRPVKW